MSTRLLIFLVAIGMLLQTGVGHADAIDGVWCSTDGMRMSIRGEKSRHRAASRSKATTAGMHSIRSFRPGKTGRVTS
jgi:hypothetical protein